MDGDSYWNVQYCRFNEQVWSIIVILPTSDRLTRGCQRWCCRRVSIKLGKRNAHIHRINRSRSNKRIIPNASHVEVPSSVAGLLEVVMQRHVEDAKLIAGYEHFSRTLPRADLTCVPNPSRYREIFSRESLQNSPTANKFGCPVSWRTCLIKPAMKFSSICLMASKRNPAALSPRTE